MKHTSSRFMSRLIFVSMVAAALVSWSGTAAYAQGIVTSSLSGVVVDTGGGVIPGASVIVTNDETGTKFETVTTSTGAFSLPALSPGAYTVTVSLTGFKTAVVKAVRLLPATPHDVKVTLEVGKLEETVTVQGVSELVQTRSATISSTVNVDSINMLPLPTRNAINFIALLPGVNTTGVNRDSNFLGLPDSATAITLDGVNNNENFNKSTEGLFAMVTPRQDAVEAVTVTTAVPGSESGGHGGVTIAFVTRSGTDRFTGSAYEYWRNPVLNTNYYFNKIRNIGKNQVKINQYGFRQGGPIVIPRLYDGHGKAFFFFNYEQFRMPTSFSRNRNIMTPEAQSGIFKWGSRQVNLYDLAKAKGQTSTPDPTVAAVLSAIRAAVQKTGTVTAATDPNTMTFNFLSPGVQPENQATARIDYNLGAKHRVTGTWTHQSIDRNPDHLNGVDVRFPGAPNWRRYISYRNITSGALRSVFGTTMVNELRGGIKWGPSYFGSTEINPGTFADQGGRALVLGNIGQTLTAWYTSNTPSARSPWSWNLDETFNWQRASHSLKFGGSYYEGHVWVTNQTLVPQINFGVNDNDPAAAMFTTANFTGASGTQLNYARQLYALLTGRVTAITADARLDENTGQYKLLGPRTQRLIQHEYGFFGQDVWRVNQKLTINAGLRWDLQLPIEPTNSIMSRSTFADLCGISGVGSKYGCNLYQPGASGGKTPTFVEYKKGEYGYKTDWNNAAPSIGFAWRPYVNSGFGRTILGDPDQATFRAGYSMAYSREGMALFTGVVGGNPGSTISVNRSPDLQAPNNIVNPGETWPVLLRDESRLYTPSFAQSPVYPIVAMRADNISIFDPDIEVARVRSVTMSFQRALTKDMAFEIRYNGTWGKDIWNQQNYNEVNILENGFLNEFMLAQRNLQANQAAYGYTSKGNTFAYTGAPGTSPLPKILAYFQGLTAAQASDASKYTSSLFTSSTYLTPLAKYNPAPGTFASNLFGDAGRRANALAAGLPANFFLVNPDVNNAYIYKSVGFTIFNALQLELRQRMAGGLQFTINYQYARAYESRNLGQRYGLVSQVRTEVPPHALKMLWNYSLPFGRGRRFGSDMSRWLDTIVGGWEFHGAGRIQSQWVDFGNYRLVGMTLQELQKAYKVRIGPDPATGVTTVWMLPQDIIDNTIRAFNVSATSATGYSTTYGVPSGRYIAPANGPDCIQVRAGDCAPLNNYVRGPIFKSFDMSVAKKFPLKGRVSFEVRFDAINVFNAVNFNTPGTLVGSAATIAQVTSGYTDTSNTFNPGGRLGQLVVRFNW